jgi:chromosome partitioning protein
VAALIREARPFNEKLQAVCFLNRADAIGQDNRDAIKIASEIPGLHYLDAPLGNRKAYRTAASQGLAVTEVRPSDHKATSEIRFFYQALVEITADTTLVAV